MTGPNIVRHVVTEPNGEYRFSIGENGTVLGQFVPVVAEPMLRALAEMRAAEDEQARPVSFWFKFLQISGVAYGATQ